MISEYCQKHFLPSKGLLSIDKNNCLKTFGQMLYHRGTLGLAKAGPQEIFQKLPQTIVQTKYFLKIDVNISSNQKNY
jgi:hypothetical protein